MRNAPRRARREGLGVRPRREGAVDERLGVLQDLLLGGEADRLDREDAVGGPADTGEIRLDTGQIRVRDGEMWDGLKEG